MNHTRALLITFAAIAILGIGGWFAWRGYLPTLNEIRDAIPDTLTPHDPALSFPEPLRQQDEPTDATLTREGILEWTNQHRQQNGVEDVQLNAQLTAAAEWKVNDMFSKQYFAHVSPDGTDAGDIASQFGYAYIAIGENLALGNFEGDQDLVQAWMDSEGHRENILKDSYDEIGIAVQRGTFEGATVWLAVQIFGRPQSACDAPDEHLHTTIEVNIAAQGALVEQANTLRAEIEAMDEPKNRREANAYNAKVKIYNALVEQINALNTEIGTLTEQYNAEVEAYNSCAQGS